MTLIYAYQSCCILEIQLTDAVFELILRLHFVIKIPEKWLMQH